MDNFLPQQYQADRKIAINHCYLKEQFSDREIILKEIATLVENEDFTLGEKVDLFEKQVGEMIGVKHVIGVNSGTDALRLGLIALGIGKDDEVITTPYTFFATIGAIMTTGAKPVFVDIGPDYNLNVANIEPRKNLLRLLAAYGRLDGDLRQRYPLLLAGGAGWHDEATRDICIREELSRRHRRRARHRRRLLARGTRGPPVAQRVRLQLRVG